MKLRTVFVVDERSTGLVTDLNAIAGMGGYGLQFHAHQSVEQMFGALDGAPPDLILLHHHWQGLTIAQIVERLFKAAPETRVIVFTGQSVDISELVQCVRSGVADYWSRRGSLDPTTVCRQISHYCASSEWTMRRLQMPSGTQQQLLDAAEGAVRNVEELSRLVSTLKSENGDLRSTERAELIRTALLIGKLVVVIAVLGGTFVVAFTYTRHLWGVLGLVGILALFFLLLEGRVSEALFKWKGGTAKVKGKT